MRLTGVEPAHPCEYKDLNLARLPIPPQPRRVGDSIRRRAIGKCHYSDAGINVRIDPGSFAFGNKTASSLPAYTILMRPAGSRQIRVGVSVLGMSWVNVARTTNGDASADSSN